MYELGLLFKNEGFGNPYRLVKREWVTAAVGAAISIGSAIYGAAASAKKERQARKEETAAHNSNMAYYRRKYNESYADTAAGQNMIRQARDYANENWKKAQGASAVGGGTDAATAMAKEAGNKMVGNTIANMAANDTARKDAAGEAMVSERNSYTQQKASNLRQQGANIASTASAMGNAVGGLVSGLDKGSSTATSATSGATGNAKGFTNAELATNNAEASKWRIGARNSLAGESMNTFNARNNSLGLNSNQAVKTAGLDKLKVKK